MSEEEHIPEENTKKQIPNQSADRQDSIEESGKTSFPGDSSAAQPQTSIPDQVRDKPQTEEMEVHHHGHVHHRKKWKEYLFQFFMFFLAVFCGFLAEYKLEHTIEHQREKKFIRSLVQDLNTDISRIEEYIDYRNVKLKKADSLIHLLISGEYKNAGSTTYYLFLGVIRGWAFIPAYGTMQQLKNSGGLRLIRKQHVVDSIIAYDGRISAQQFQDEVEQRFLDKCRDLTGDVFDAGVFLEAYNIDTNKEIRPAGNPKLIITDPVAINKLATQVIYVRGSTKFSIIDGTQLRQRAASLIEHLKLEYNLD